MNERLRRELDEFVDNSLKPCLDSEHMYNENNFPNYYEKKRHDKFKEKIKSEEVDSPPLTNHEICHEMFWNAFMGHSKMFIQMRILKSHDNTFSNIQNGKKITLQCSLLTMQMLNYDLMMFNAMSNNEYREDALKYYRPYLFDYVAEIDEEDYDRLRNLQNNFVKSKKYVPCKRTEKSPYFWFVCTFDSNIDGNYNIDSDYNINLDGYVIQSASTINKIKSSLHIIGAEDPPIEDIKNYLDKYEFKKTCLVSDAEFIEKIESNLGHNRLSSIDIYKIGNGNCVFAQEENSDTGFFYDIGFNCRQRPGKASPTYKYNYYETMQKIYAKKPSFVILSHWDMDHIAGSFAANDKLFERYWFAPDCYDAYISAKRLAKYLDLGDHLFLAKRRPRRSFAGRLIGHQINITDRASHSVVLATYRLYMGKKNKCDRSYPNCEGIVIEYTDKIKNITVLMMGDVNYASFNASRITNGDPLFADTEIDYLIAPHHGSKHTAYEQIADKGRSAKKGIKAVFCCKNDSKNDRPNDDHKKKLEERFKCVCTTEDALPPDHSIKISI